MQIDFHHGVTYVVARLAGFEHEAASIIAYCAQYVDDATNAGLIRFDNGTVFQRMSSAHKMLNYRNFQELATHRVWIPFHFLPGNGGLPRCLEPEGGLISKLICRPNSYIAQEMVREAIKCQDFSHGLHRWGVTMHVYTDTWAHQGFSGVSHWANEARNVVDSQGKADRNLMNRLKGYFVNEALPLGHGAVLSNPDKPFLCWGYTNGYGEKIIRDNPRDFLQAANCMYQAMRRYLLKDPEAIAPEIPEPDKTIIATMLKTITDRSGKVRHKKWLQAIAAGKFSFGEANICYIPKGKNSWKHLALGTEQLIDKEHQIFTYSPTFLASDWKLFHDALQAHHSYVIHELLPLYGICVGKV